MTLEDLKRRVIEEGLASVRATETGAELAGGIEGFERCRDPHTPDQFREALARANRDADVLFREHSPREEDIAEYWRLRYIALQIEHCFRVLDCHWRTLPYLSGRAVQQYTRLVGVAGRDDAAI